MKTMREIYSQDAAVAAMLLKHFSPGLSIKVIYKSLLNLIFLLAFYFSHSLIRFKDLLFTYEVTWADTTLS